MAGIEKGTLWESTSHLPHKQRPAERLTFQATGGAAIRQLFGGQGHWYASLRGSEGAQRVKDTWLSPSFPTVLGKDVDLGLKVSRYLPGMATLSNQASCSLITRRAKEAI